MAEFLILVVLLMVAWDYFTDWRDRKGEQTKREQKVALRQKHLSFVADAPSAWEAYGDALRDAGFLAESILAYEEARRRLAPQPGDGIRSAAGSAEPLEVPEGEAADGAPSAGHDPEEDPFITGRQSGSVTALLSMGSIVDPLYEEKSEMPALIVPVSELVPAPETEEQAALAVMEETASVPRTVPAFHVDSSAGYGLDNKIRLVQMEIAHNANPEKYGQSIATREQTCRMCGALNGADLQNCSACGAALPVQTFLDTWHNRDMRQELNRYMTRVGINLAIVLTCIWFVSWLPPLAKFSVTIAALIVIPLKLLQRLGDPQEREL